MLVLNGMVCFLIRCTAGYEVISLQAVSNSGAHHNRQPQGSSERMKHVSMCVTMFVALARAICGGTLRQNLMLFDEVVGFPKSSLLLLVVNFVGGLTCTVGMLSGIAQSHGLIRRHQGR